MTRQEYFNKQGFSTHESINNPDGEIDEEFIKHCDGLKKLFNNFIDSCKKDRVEQKVGADNE